MLGGISGSMASQSSWMNELQARRDPVSKNKVMKSEAQTLKVVVWTGHTHTSYHTYTPHTDTLTHICHAFTYTFIHTQRAYIYIRTFTNAPLTPTHTLTYTHLTTCTPLCTHSSTHTNTHSCTHTLAHMKSICNKLQMSSTKNSIFVKHLLLHINNSEPIVPWKCN